jgi:TolB-like protein/Flp pilus assembly protein TadD
MPPQHADEAGSADRNIVALQLARILSSPDFINAGKLAAFLEYVITKSLAGEAEHIKEYTIGVEVFGKPESFDPRLDTLVRVQASNLRGRLEKYYSGQGLEDPIRIELPRGTYVPVVRSMKTQKPLDRKKPHPIAAWIGLLVLAILGGVALFYSARKSLSPLPENSIAVLPFLDMSPEKDQEYFCDGMTEELISQLARIDGLRVVARTSAFQFKGKPQDVRQVGKQLNVTTVLEGSVRKAGGHLRITVQLIGVSDGYHLWSESYDRELRDVFDIQMEISRSIAGVLRVSLGRSAPAVSDTSNLEAYNLYLLGRYHWSKRTESDLEAAVRDFEAAVRLDPAYAQAYAGLADSYLQLGTWASRDPRQMMPKATQYAVKALELNEGLAEAHTSLGAIHLLYDWNVAAARREYERAIALNPGYVTAHWWYAFLLLASGELQEARRELDLALRRDPLSVPILVDAVSFDIESGYPSRALVAARKALELDPTSTLARISLGSALAAQNRLPEALAAFRTAAAADPGNARALQFLAGVHARLGERREAEEAIVLMLDLSKTRFVACDIAAAYAAAGHSDLAFAWLERAVEARSTCIGWLHAGRLGGALDPFRALASSGRYRAVMAKAVSNQ